MRVEELESILLVQEQRMCGHIDEDQVLKVSNARRDYGGKRGYNKGKRSFWTKTNKLHLVHSYIYGPVTPESNGSVNDFSRKI